MKTIVALSDTHGNTQILEKLESLFYENDHVFHMGDGAFDMLKYGMLYGKKVQAVSGNCDYGFPYELTFNIEGKKILITHGHGFSVKSGLDRLKTYAKENGYDVVFYGHTHTASIIEDDGVLMINPGALSYQTAKRSYCYVVIANSKITAKIVEI